MALVEGFSRIHDRLGELFSLHQELLLERRLAEAQRKLATYRALIGLHMRHEERSLLPVYDELVPNPSFPTRLYTGQHRRMRELLDGAAERLALIDPHGAGAKRAVLALLDYESTYKHLVEHHEDAERRGLFAALGFELDARHQAELVDPCIAEWRHAERMLLQHGSPVHAEAWPL